MLVPKEEHHQDGYNDADDPKNGIPPHVVQLGQVTEIHPVNARQEGQGDENRADHG